ncbi:methyltransferase [Asaia bogorensis NBRC 16594]|uniref:Methyltransferase n=2 Tax=Asaia bogorensis TaxID=91915 RepID=A0AAN4R5N7_9PROT|nr:methyltransferase [Asaia bogorensis NBRC 16594]
MSRENMTLTIKDSAPYGAYSMTLHQRLARVLMHDTLLGRTSLRRRFVARFRDEATGPVDATLFGLKVRFHPRDNQTDAKGAVCGKAYNATELRWLARALHPDDVFLDIGANMGFFSLFAATRGAQIVAIEANPVLQVRFEASFGFNDLPFTLLRGAVGDTNQRVRMAPRDDDLGSGTVEDCEEGRIVMRPLLAWLAEAKVERIDCLKIDIEGYEDRALIPFFRHAPAHLRPRYLMMERATHPSRREALETCLVRSGLYRLQHQSRANLFYVLNRPQNAVQTGRDGESQWVWQSA